MQAYSSRIKMLLNNMDTIYCFYWSLTFKWSLQLFIGHHIERDSFFILSIFVALIIYSLSR